MGEGTRENVQLYNTELVLRRVVSLRETEINRERRIEIKIQEKKNGRKGLFLD